MRPRHLRVSSDFVPATKSAVPVPYFIMAFFQSAITVLQTLVIALGAGLGIWGAINLLEGYGNDNPGANAHVQEGRISPKSSRMTALQLFRNNVAATG